jgi:virginiamycin A acetyltransferase
MTFSQRIQWILRALFYGIEFILALPFALVFILMGWIGIMCGRYSEVSQLAAHIPFYFGENVRYLYYKATLKKVGRRVTFKYGSFCQYHETSIGDRVIIGYYDALAHISIGNDVLIGGFVSFTSGRKIHAFDDPKKKINQQEGVIEIITIGSDVWIGTQSVITTNVGNRCIIGAGSVVVKPVEDHSIYAGNPAKLIRKLD